jgi:hypothetical protein
MDPAISSSGGARSTDVSSGWTRTYQAATGRPGSSTPPSTPFSRQPRSTGFSRRKSSPSTEPSPDCSGREASSPNADHLPVSSERVATVSQELLNRWQEAQLAEGEDYYTYRDALRDDATLGALVDEGDRRFADKRRGSLRPSRSTVKRSGSRASLRPTKCGATTPTRSSSPSAESGLGPGPAVGPQERMEQHVGATALVEERAPSGSLQNEPKRTRCARPAPRRESTSAACPPAARSRSRRSRAGTLARTGLRAGSRHPGPRCSRGRHTSRRDRSRGRGGAR